MVPQRFRTEIGVATGLIGEFGGLGGFFLPTLLGSVKQGSGSYAIGWLVMSGFVLFGLVVLRIRMVQSAGWQFSWAPTPEVQLEAAKEELKAVNAEIKAVNVITELKATRAELEAAKAVLEATKATRAELEAAETVGVASGETTFDPAIS